MKKFTLISLLATLAFSPLCGETKTYWKTIEPYHKMTRVYWHVRQLDENSVRFKEFNKAMADFRTQCIQLQKKVKENDLGDDLMFDKYAELLIRQISHKGYDRYDARGKRNRKASGSAMRMDDIPVGHLFILLSNDFKTMREAGIHNFPTPESLKEWLPVFQYIRMFRYFREVADKVEVHSKNYAWSYHFDQRLFLMLKVSQRVQKILEQQMPELVKYNNIHTETRVLLAYCSVVRKNSGVVDVSLNSDFNRLAKGGKEDNRERVMKSDMRLAMQNIERILNRFRNEIRKRQSLEKQAQRKKEQDAKRKKQQRERQQKQHENQQRRAQAAQDAKERALSAKEKASLKRMSDDDLAGHMANRYNAIFPADRAKSVSADRVQKCMDAMTDTQKQYYESVKARYVRTGSSAKQAELKALKTVRPLLSTPRLRPSRLEMINTLNK